MISGFGVLVVIIFRMGNSAAMVAIIFLTITTVGVGLLGGEHGKNMTIIYQIGKNLEMVNI